MTDAELLQHVKTSIAVALGADPGELRAETTLFAELGVDSVDLLDISYELERLTGCELELAELFRERDGGAQRPNRDLTLAQLVEVLKARLGSAGPPP
jgi:acyl carrier protein